jgi:cytochrome c oxidase cbb3-type subunit III
VSASSYRRCRVAIAFVTSMFCACDSLPGRPKPADIPLRPSAITDFSQLYSDNCAGCHGADGKFGAAITLSNPVYLAIADNTSIRRAVANGVRGTAMPPFALSDGGPLTDKQIDIVITSMRKTWGQAESVAVGAPPYASTQPGDSNRGAEVYVANCQSCHGADGKGGSAAGSIVDASYLSLVSDQYLRTIVIAGRPDLQHPDWKQYPSGQPLNSTQVSDVVAWIVSKRPPIPASVAQSN